MNRFDASLICRRFSKAARSYDSAATIQLEMISRLFYRLDGLALSPKRVVDVGCGTGNAFDGLSKRYLGAEAIGVDIALPMLELARRKSSRWRLVCGDMNRLPLADGCCDLLVSNAALQWSESPRKTLSEWLRVVSPGGWLCATTFGKRTLSELRTAMTAADRFPHVHSFIDLAELEEALITLKAESIQTESLLSLDHADSLSSIMTALRAIGATNADRRRSRGLMGKTAFTRLKDAYEHQRQFDGLPVTWETLAFCCRKRAE